MSANHDFLAQRDVPFSSLQGAPPPGINKEEQLWQEAVQRHPKGSFLKFPYDATLLAGLFFALGFLIYALLNFDPTSEQSFVDVINLGFPIAMFISAVFMAVGYFQRRGLQINENKVEKEYRQLLNEYVDEHNPLTQGFGVDSDQERLIDVLSEKLDDLKESLNANFRGLTDTMNGFVGEMADYSGKEIGSALDAFSKEIQDLPEQLSQALEI
ncbi:MAG: hypothetical protein GY846_17740 [Deltaproteobacteria bacterium]|nr:hypothetical protein [Deltaproteobacteria bacterium]